MKHTTCLTPKENQWIVETFEKMRQEALQCNKLSKACVYRKIIKSLKKYPLPIKSVSDAMKLEGVGKMTAPCFIRENCPDLHEINEEERKTHQYSVLVAMTRFAKSLETNLQIQFERSPEKETRIRLTPGNSAWSILLTMYVYSDHYGEGELLKEDIIKSTESLKNFDIRIKISSWKALDKLMKEGYITNRLLSDPPQIRRPKKQKCYVYRLTESGKLAGETILCELDTEIFHSFLRKNSLKTVKNDVHFPPTPGIVLVNPTNEPHVDVASHFIKKIQPSQFNNIHTQKKELTDHLLDYFCLKPSNSELRESQKHNDDLYTTLIQTPTAPSIQTKNMHSSIDHDKNNVLKHLDYLETESHNTLLSQTANVASQDELLLGLLRYTEKNTLEKNAFCIVCLVDHREAVYYKNDSLSSVITGRSLNKIRVTFCELKTFFLKFLTENKMEYESTLLPVGDFAWVCRLRKPKELFLSTKLQSLIHCTRSSTNECHSNSVKGYNQNIDFVLPYLVERKTVSDFTASIMDGRYEDQKFRLLRSPGIECIIYLVEGPQEELYQASTYMHTCGMSKSIITTTSISTAIASTEIREGIHVVFLSDISETATFLCSLQTYLYKQLDTFMKPFDHLPHNNVGNTFLVNLIANSPLRSVWTTRSQRLSIIHDIFGRQLKCIEFLGDRTVLFLLRHFDNPAQLKESLEKYPKNSTFRSQLIALNKNNISFYSQSKVQQRLLSTRVMNALRTLYAPSTVPYATTPEIRTKKSFCKRDRLLLQKDTFSPSNDSVKKRVGLLKKLYI
ncbi:crossover junction endonuclease MUS81-like isoform X2 [Hylaeus volcanicus]|uniref:crossover junction endonuclease MUS81-like isoform X2 n=1 Tax=Hylaeus volcanicus TaxID=313075 RepID=UPI0023B816FF|nr:crossover junction endonuclease MUS81-like isoform X2 [Hylaeus volcanicus]